MEPHKPEKIAQNRQRLISILSLVDQMVDRILFGPYALYDKNHCMDRAGKTGWSPMPVGFYDLMEYFPGQVLATDCSAFDWTYPAYLPDMILDCKLAQTKETSIEFRRACRNRIKEVLGPLCTLRLPDGARYIQSVWGIMKSGWLLTIGWNSDAQDIITNLAWSRAYPNLGPCPRLWSMGDDVLMRWREDLDPKPLEAELTRAGILSKFAMPVREFAGYAFGRDPDIYVDPLYVDKHKFLLAHTSLEQLEEVVTAYGLLYALARPATRAWLDPILSEYARWTRDTYVAWAYGILGGAEIALSDKAGVHFSLG